VSEDFGNEKLDEIKPFQKYAEKFPLYKTRGEEFAVTSEYYDLIHIYIPLALRIIDTRPDGNDAALLNLLVIRKTYLEHDIVNRNLRLCLKAARSPTYFGRGLTVYDRLLAAIDGLIYCIRRKFDPYRGYKLSTYATRWMHQRIGKAIGKTGGPTKVPGHIQDQISKINMVVREYVKNHSGEKPTAEKISYLISQKYIDHKTGEPLNIDAETVAELGRLKWKHVSLDESGDESGPMVDTLSSPEAYQPEESAAQSEMIEKVRFYVNQLEPKERTALTMKFGFVDGTTKSNKAIASLLGVSQKEYANIELSAYSNLKKMIPVDFLDFLR
jgi:RNA polymerase primary sigma factor